VNQRPTAQHSSRTIYTMASNQGFLFLIVGKNEPLYEAEIHKRGAAGNADTSVARQSYFVVHSSLDLVDKATWASQNVC